MKTIDRRVCQLEDRFGSSKRPRPRIRLQVRPPGSKLVLADAECTRALSPDGTVMELVEFQDHSEGPDEISEAELDRWVNGFPVQTHQRLLGRPRNWPSPSWEVSVERRENTAFCTSAHRPLLNLEDWPV